MATSAPTLEIGTPAPRRVGLRDIAHALDVSLMTVSLALRNSPKVSAATRQRVRQTADRLGYRPDPELARLMTRLHGGTRSADRPLMAIVDISTSRLAPGAANYCEDVRLGAMKRAEALGYLATCFHLVDYEGDLRRLLKVLHYRGIRGVLLLPPLSPVELPAGLDWTPFSVIAASYAITPLQFHRVVPHQFIDMCRLLRLLESQGHNRIGAVFQQGFEERIHFHFTAAIKLHGHGERILRMKNQDEISRAEVKAWLETARPDAVVCPFALKLQAAMPLRARGERGPELVSLGVTERSPFACWDERPAEIGSDAAVLLAGMMQHNETGVPESPRTSMVHGAFHEPAAPAALAVPTRPARLRPAALAKKRRPALLRPAT